MPNHETTRAHDMQVPSDAELVAMQQRGELPSDTELASQTTRPRHLRVDVSGVAIYVRSEGEYQHLEHVNLKLAIAKLALHKIRVSDEARSSRYAAQAIEAMKNV